MIEHVLGQAEVLREAEKQDKPCAVEAAAGRSASAGRIERDQRQATMTAA